MHSAGLPVTSRTSSVFVNGGRHSRNSSCGHLLTFPSISCLSLLTFNLEREHRSSVIESIAHRSGLFAISVAWLYRELCHRCFFYNGAKTLPYSIAPYGAPPRLLTLTEPPHSLNSGPRTECLPTGHSEVHIVVL